MATTRIMPLHVGKGRTESRANSDIIDYVVNPKKTDNGRLITGYACDSRTADAEFLAADLLAQGEHGPDSVVVFVTTSEALLKQVEAEVERQAALLSRGSIIREVLDKHAYGFLVSSIQEGV